MATEAVTNMGKEAARNLTDAINSCNFSPTEFCEQLEKEHRYLQACLTDLAIRWLEHNAEQYVNRDYDGRNEYTCKKAYDMLHKIRN